MKFEIYMYYVAMQSYSSAVGLVLQKEITLHLMVYLLKFKFTDSVKKS